MRTGLSIGGGGANGAYALGVIDVLSENQIEIDCVAGTSVGGLIAAAYSIGSMEGAKEVLLNSGRANAPLRITRSRNALLAIYKLTWFLAAYLILIVPVFFKHGWQYIASTFACLMPGKYGWRVAFGLAVIVATLQMLLPAFILFYSVDWFPLTETTGLLMFVFPLLVFLPLFFSYYSLTYFRNPFVESASSSHDSLIFFIRMMGLYLAAAVFALGFATSFFALIASNSIGAFFTIVGIILLAALGIALVAFIVLALLGLIAYLTIQAANALDRLSVFENKPLRDEISKLLPNTRFSIPTYVTSSVYKRVHDPKRVKSQIAVLNERTGSAMKYLPLLSLHVPFYHRVSDIDDREMVIDRLMASAAIPARVMPKVRIDGELHVDGMTSDNVPLVPLIYWEGCDRMIIIDLSEKPITESERLETAAIAERNSRLNKHPIPADRTLVDRAVHRRSFSSLVTQSTAPERLASSTQLLVIQPSVHLGSPTDFSKEKQRTIYELGRKDALTALQKIRPAHPTP